MTHAVVFGTIGTLHSTMVAVVTYEASWLDLTEHGKVDRGDALIAWTPSSVGAAIKGNFVVAMCSWTSRSGAAAYVVQRRDKARGSG
ncbi:hypothetical protein NL676_017971 [Syzygium grande]|nr:hypothetical protein NL676_017971 [Syzygium grande]